MSLASLGVRLLTLGGTEGEERGGVGSTVLSFCYVWKVMNVKAIHPEEKCGAGPSARGWVIPVPTKCSP